MIDLALLILIAGYAYGLGTFLLRAGRISFATLEGRTAARTALGLGVVAYTVLAIGLAGSLTRDAFIGTAAVLFVAAFAMDRTVRRLAGTHACVQTSNVPPDLHSFTLGSRVGTTAQWAFGLLAIAGTMTNALAPPTAGDALCYHLEIPKRFVADATIEYLPFTDNSLFPFQTEMLFTLALLFGTPVLAQLVHWLIGTLFALAVVELAAPVVGRSLGRWAAVVALLAPGVTNQMTAPLNDLALALFITLMISAWADWRVAGGGRPILMAGTWGGLALGTKLVAAGLIGLIVIATAWLAFRNPLCIGRAGSWPARSSVFGAMRRACLVLVLLALPVCVIAGVWYARSWWYLGNPIYPYFNGIFGLEPHTRSVLITVANPFGLPWWATMHPELFGGRGVQFGAVFLALLPGLFMVQPGDRLRSMLGIASAFAAIWFAVRQDLRFLLPVIGLLATGVAAVIGELRGRSILAFRIAVGCTAFLLAFQSLIVLKRAWPCFAVAYGAESREAYLDRHEPSYRVARFANRCLPKDSRIISQDYRGLYFDTGFVREASMRRHCPYPERGGQLVAKLAEQFTHLLLVQAYNPDTAVYDNGFPERLGSALDDLPLIYTVHFESPSGDRRDYKLFQLPEWKPETLPSAN